MNTPHTPAAELAANFQVAELEPRLENGWGTPIEAPTEPMCPSGQPAGPGGQCN